MTGGSRPVAVIGDVNVDLVLRGDVVPRFGQAEQLADEADLVLGGAAGIVAAGVARLGASPWMCSRVGDDAFGRSALAALGERGVDVTGVEVVSGETTGVSVILSTPGDRAILTAPGVIPTLTAERAADWLDAWEGEPGVLHMASYFLQPSLAAGLGAVLAAARARGWVTSLDTNWDPREEWRGVGDLLEHLDVLLPNASELRALAAAIGVTGDDEQLARAIARGGPRVVVKDGARGGWSVTADGERASAPGLVLDVVDTTGAGDSFDAGYLSALAAGVTDEAERVRWAAVAGSLSTRGAGGTASQATRAELDAAMAS